MFLPSPDHLDFQGKGFRFGSALLVVLVLGFAYSGFSDEFPMVSVPLGFEIFGSDRSRTWVSQNGFFAFGFLEDYQRADNIDGFVVGIRYNLGVKAANLPVWTVGGGVRVSENSTVRLSLDGRLILYDNPSGLIVWSSNTSSLGVKKATLLNNGNLVLMDLDDNVVWESFDSPTTTLLPGQSLHFPQTLRAPSTKSVSSYYNFVIRYSGELALVWEANVTYWRVHLSSNDVIKEAEFDSNGAFGLIDDKSRRVWSITSKDFEDRSAVLRHLRIDSDGNLRIYSWLNSLRVWRVEWQAVENQCNVFGSCGLYSICGFNSTGPICDCLYQDSVTWGSDLPLVDSSGSGCRKMADLDNCKMKTSMLTLRRTVLYGLYPPQDVDMMLSEAACKEYCSNDTSCVAVTSKNDGSGVCTVKRTSFVSGYRSPSIPATSFLKVCLVPQAVLARGANPQNNAKSFPLTSEGFVGHGGDKKMFIRAIILIVSVTTMGFITIEMFVFWYIYRRRQIKEQARIPFGKDIQMNCHHSFLIRVSFEEIKELTSNFANQLGPSVYKGVSPNEIPVAVKVLNNVVATEKDFRVLVSTLGGMYHQHLVSLKGFCFEGEQKCLLYEYVSNGSLDKFLFNMEQRKSELNWQQRLDIALGVARALAYLHTQCQTCVAHGNLRLESVLLDEKFVPKVTDFGLRTLVGKEAASSSESPAERDIFMFGELLLQIVTCERDILGSNMHSLVSMINEEHKLEDSVESEKLEIAIKIALWCLQNQPFLRPSIGEVVRVLEGSLSVDRPPLNFAFKQGLIND
ncbi:G-type lectin S-receptor-like serine/threonine-protein kinase SD3-1 [Durio zibethinus]|uniref:Receptor-like serine/threonine-protein kinase n=1 Tax=Durio zibethinus TaxID=66656 RepID=A0A6P5XQN6_DURZI|nr:G-type lectin S-receptor-like serine/threonine-protein kinase SD3-1 [Durio zibethinus]